LGSVKNKETGEMWGGGGGGQGLVFWEVKTINRGERCKVNSRASKVKQETKGGTVYLLGTDCSTAMIERYREVGVRGEGSKDRHMFVEKWKVY